MRKVLIIDTSILCVWLQIPGMAPCGPAHDQWDHARVQKKIEDEEAAGTTFVLPLASIIETGNHISQSGGDRLPLAQRLAQVMNDAADEVSPWAAFGDQGQLWSPESLKSLAERWPPLAVNKLSLGDATIKEVADFYSRSGFHVEMLTGDQGLKAHEPARSATRPRRRR